MSEDKKFYQLEKFRRLKSKWYAKLKNDGFEDIEWHDAKTSEGEQSSYLKSHFSQTYISDSLSNKDVLINSERYKAQRAIDHYNMHGEFNELDKKLWELYAEGASYRQMSQALRKLHKSKTLYSVFWVFHRIKHLRCEMIRFNYGDINGLKASDETKDPLFDIESLDEYINGDDNE
jgi:hypothetical protein